jgi:ubiquinone/menaquinone biosynthesis C-methylase UbiE
MGKEINLLKNYPKAKRDLTKRLESKTEEVRSVARKFDKEFFDGERKFGYGGFSYNPKYWSEVVKDFSDYYNLVDGSKILDVGCAKGFMLYDFYKQNPNLDLYGIDISKYAIDNSVPEIKYKLKVANATNLPYEDNYFDLVISINTVHNLDKIECATALREISRVSKKNAFLTVDAFNNEDEEKRMYAWNLTAKTIMSVDEWITFFDQKNYDGDYFWFIP